MSSYNTAQARLTACVSTVRKDLPRLERMQDALVNGFSSHRLQELAGQAAMLAPTEAVAFAAEVARAPGIEGLPAELHTALAGIGPHSVRVDGSRLTDALTTAASAMATVELATVAETVAFVLPTLGHDVRRVDGLSSVAFEAVKGHETMLVLVTEGGRVEVDHLNVQGTTCDVRQAEFVAAMAMSGVQMGDQIRVPHGDAPGGSLIAQAAREGGADLASGAIVVADRATARRTAMPSQRGRMVRRAGA